MHIKVHVAADVAGTSIIEIEDVGLHRTMMALGTPLH
jgi:hypothetical protein